MGRVYLAQHLTLQRRLAVKVMHSWLAGHPDLVRRFLSEGRAAGTIRHPNIVEVLDCGTLDDGAPYIMMEYLDGEPLAVRMGHPLPMRHVVDIAIQTAAGLAAAHARGVVHRDLKPDNLFLIRDPRRPGSELVKILDFGIAKLLDGSGTRRTDTGTLVGTPLYMSPEQCLGSERIDARSDIYSLGVILYEMLCGRPPFRATGTGALVMAHASAPVPAPRSRNPKIPVLLEKIVLRMLAKAPAARLPSMDAVRVELAAALNDARQRWPDSLTPPPLPPSKMDTLPAVPMIKPRRRPLRLALAVAACAGLVLAGDLAGRRRDPPAPALRPMTAAAPARSVPVPPAAIPAASPPPAPAAVPQPITVLLSSIPPGARVTADGIALGVTPVSYVVSRPDGPVAFVFTHPGYSASVVRAQPAGDLRVVARLQPRGPKLRDESAPAAQRRTPSPPEIKSER